MRILAGLFMLLPVLCGGCAGPLLLPAGMSALEASTMGLNALEGGSAVWSRRTLASDEAAAFADAITAADRAINRLEFTRGQTLIEDGTAEFNVRDRDKDITIRLTSRTPRVTKIKIRVGLFGDQSLSLLILNAIKLELSRVAQDRGGPPGESPGAATGLVMPEY
ncbi:MAG: DUF3568 family protein [Phycisphaerales bacterium]|nr:DUF3568 family protein [Phycisphaerales bacterium]